MVHVGIDIGTSNTVVASLENGQPTVWHVDHEPVIPSVIAVTEIGGHVLVGAEAVDEWSNPDRDPDSIFRRWKLAIGDERVFRTMRFGGPDGDPVDITPEFLTTALVEHVLTTVAAGIGGSEVESVVVTVPHGWRRENTEKCQATRRSAAAAAPAGQAVTVQDITVSEPVAAAVYWLWGARTTHPTTVDDFAGKCVLVCDVGGGTFDLSLVRVGGVGEPLDVVDAVNNDFAGDYVTALVMGQAAAQFNAEYGADLATDPDEILRQLGDAPNDVQRTWFGALQRMQQELSTIIAAAARRGSLPSNTPRRIHLDGGNDGGRSITFSLSPQQFVETLRPFHARSRELLQKFLARHSGGTRPYAVVFAGGGSRIAGIRDDIVRPVLAEFDPTGCDEVLSRILMNDRKVDQAIALGAALVANGVVSVQERLLCDIGIEMTIPESFAAELDLAAGTSSILLSPILPRGAVIPAVFRSEDHRFTIRLAGGESLDLMTVIDDDPNDPYLQRWTVDHPAGQSSLGCSIVVTADSDGVLRVDLARTGGGSTVIEGKLSRKRTGSVKLQIEAGNADAATVLGMPRVSPRQLAEAQARLRGGGK